MHKRNLIVLCFATLAITTFGTVLYAAMQQGLGYSDSPIIPGTKWHVHDGERPQPRIVTPGATFSDNAPAPADAVVLSEHDFTWENGFRKLYANRCLVDSISPQLTDPTIALATDCKPRAGPHRT